MRRARCTFELLADPSRAHRNIEECLILRGVFDKLGPGMRSDPPTYEELFEIVGEGIDELQAWCHKWSDMMGEWSVSVYRGLADLPLSRRDGHVRFELCLPPFLSLTSLHLIATGATLARSKRAYRSTMGKCAYS